MTSPAAPTLPRVPASALWRVLGLLLLASLFGCGPQSGAGGVTPGAGQSGTAPFIRPFNSSFPTPAWRLEGTQVVFPVTFSILADDPDVDMRRLLVSVAYTDCNGIEQVVDNLIYFLSADEQLQRLVQLDHDAAPEVSVPIGCYAIGGQFTIIGRLEDFGNNLSQPLTDTLIITANQGSTG